jgi:hypothetical protein
MDESSASPQSLQSPRAWALPAAGGLWALPFAWYVARFTPLEPFAERMSGARCNLWALLQVALSVALLACAAREWRVRRGRGERTLGVTLALLSLLNAAAMADYRWRLGVLGIAYRHVPMDARPDALSDLFFRWRSPWQLGALLLLAAALHVVLQRRLGVAWLQEMYIRLAMLAAPFVLAFGALEVYLQLGPSRQPWAMYQGFQMLRLDYRLGWSHTANADAQVVTGGRSVRIRTNSRGLRDRERAYQAPVGKERILCLGDSFAFGWGVEAQERFTDVLEDRLLSDTEVINAAVEGYGTDQQYLFLRDEGFRYQPRVVLLALFPGNDFEDNSRSAAGGFPRPRFEVGPDGLRLTAPPVPGHGQGQGGPAPFSFRHHSRAYQCIARRVYLAWEALKAHRAATRGASANTDARDSGGLDSPRTAPRPEGFEVTGALLKAIAEECRRQDAKLLVMLIAPGELVNTAPDSPQAGDRWTYLARCYRAARELCRSLDLTSIDTLPEFSARTGAGEQLYIPADAHWTPRGHELAARLICQKLSEEAMLPSRCLPPGAEAIAPGP